jgi:hypothetical protein
MKIEASDFADSLPHPSFRIAFLRSRLAVRQSPP